MRSPTDPPAPALRPTPAVAPVQAKPDAPARQGTRGSRSFAELLAAAEAVQDRVELSGRPPAPGGGVPRAVGAAVQGAAGFLARHTPWLGLPLLLRPRAGKVPTPRPHDA
jgi:hypothetical protein